MLLFIDIIDWFIYTTFNDTFINFAGQAILQLDKHYLQKPGAWPVIHQYIKSLMSYYQAQLQLQLFDFLSPKFSRTQIFFALKSF